jgi:hypothetical protein
MKPKLDVQLFGFTLSRVSLSRSAGKLNRRKIGGTMNATNMKTSWTSRISSWRIVFLLITMVLISSMTAFVLGNRNVILSAGENVQTADKKPNILFIMGDDIGWMQPSIYHRGLMGGETPNIDRIGREGAIFMDYVALTYRAYPPLQAPESYNLSQILKQVKKGNHAAD